MRDLLGRLEASTIEPLQKAVNTIPEISDD
jgi:hypothetical protein